jgi:chromatin segregation and condensation protein Rec8/ScpA/Scc1 (kleisin family)
MRSSSFLEEMVAKSIDPTPEDRERVLESIANAREELMERLVLHEARRRVERERRERRRARLNRFTLGLLGR